MSVGVRMWSCREDECACKEVELQGGGVWVSAGLGAREEGCGCKLVWVQGRMSVGVSGFGCKGG